MKKYNAKQWGLIIGSLIVDEGSWDLGDPIQVRELVDRWLLAGIVVIVTSD